MYFCMLICVNNNNNKIYRMEYNFIDIEKKWRAAWFENETYKTVEDDKKKKFYVLNMFPYPSGA